MILRQTRPTQEMAEVIFKAVDACREHLRPWCPWEKKDDSVESCMKYLKEKVSKTESGERVEYGIFIKESNTYIGNIQVFDISKENHHGEIGYWLVKDATGKGYMSEALKVLEKECFIGLKFHRIQLKCDAINKTSAKVIKSCGYTYEGMLREDTYDEYRERMSDTSIFSKLLNEYNEQ